MFRYLLSGLLWGLLLSGARAQTLDVLPPTGKWVTDLADFFSPTEEQLLTRKLRTIADTSAVQIVVVTLPSLEGADIAEYAIELGQKWGVGREPYDSGIVILIARKERRIFIATGQGLEDVLPDVVVGRIIREVITPAFRQGRYYEGVSRAIDMIMGYVGGVYSPQEAVRSSPGVDKDTFSLLFVLGIILVFLLIDWLSHRRKARKRKSYGVAYQATGSEVWEGVPPVIIFGGGMGHHGRRHVPDDVEDTWSDVFVGGGGDFGGGGAGGSW